MSDETTRGRDGIRRAPRSEMTWPKGQTPSASHNIPAERSPRPLAPAHAQVWVLYLLALLTVLMPVPGSGWVRLATGSGPLMMLGLPSLLIMVLAVWRAAQVLRDRRHLAAPPALGAALWIRRVAVALMAFGVLVTVLQIFTGPIARAIFHGGRSDSGVEYFIVGVWLAMFSGWAPVGLLLFEFSRMLGFERATREKAP